MCKFNCIKYLSRCKAECCSIAPIEKELFEKHRDKLVNQPIEEIISRGKPPHAKIEQDFIFACTTEGKCCFLQDDFMCAINDDKPLVCKNYGNEEALLMCCKWQNKDGKERSRQNKRYVERQQAKRVKACMRANEKQA